MIATKSPSGVPKPAAVRSSAATAPISSSSSSSRGAASLHHFKFEIHGKVQGVFFRKYTNEEARRLGLKGYVFNTEAGTVQGEAFGSAAKLADFKRWLSTKGSPKCRIDKVVFTEEGPVTECNLTGFVVRK